jgi:AAA+ ATPase superfamily predicted ATPase
MLEAILVTNMAICKIFDPYPKSNREDFFDNEEILEDVKKLLEGKFWPLIIGPRRTGKTSILKIIGKELNGIYIDASSINSLRGLASSLINSIDLKIYVDLKILQVEINKKPVKGLQTLLNKLGQKLILIDEVQNIISPWFISLLSNAYNNSEVKFAFTGSMVGLSKALTGKGKTMFRGRPIVQIEMNPFSKDKGREFLKYGNKLCGTSILDSEIEDVVSAYRGIQGWLTYYGNFRSLGYPHEKAKEMVLNIASSIIKAEIERLGEIQKIIIKSLSLVDEIGWKDLENLCESIGKREIADWSFNHALKQLVDARLVRVNSESKKYSLIDPMYKYIMK